MGAEALPKFSIIPPPPKPPSEQPRRLTRYEEQEDDSKNQTPTVRIPEVATVYYEALEPGVLQTPDVVPAFRMEGFKGLTVAATVEKKNDRKETEQRNEDSVLLDPKTGLMGVFDGLGGGLSAGDLASRTAEARFPEQFKRFVTDNAQRSLRDIKNNLIETQFRRLSPSPATAPTVRNEIAKMADQLERTDPEMLRRALSLIQSVERVNSDILETNERESQPGSQTTACVGFVHSAPDGTRWAIIANTGDSGAFKRRGSGEIVAMTKEDSLLNQQLESGNISEEQLHQLQADPTKKVELKIKMGGELQSAQVDYKLLRRAMVCALGSRSFEPKLVVRRLEVGDEVIFATDGIIDMFENDTTLETDLPAMEQILSRKRTPTEQANELRREAKSRSAGYKKDDDSAVVIAKTI